VVPAADRPPAVGGDAAAAGRLAAAAPELRHHLVLHVATPELADGLSCSGGNASADRQPPPVRGAGVAEENGDKLRERLHALGMSS